MLVLARSDVLDRKHHSHGDTDDVVHRRNPVFACGKRRWGKSVDEIWQRSVKTIITKALSEPQAFTV